VTPSPTKLPISSVPIVLTTHHHHTAASLPAPTAAFVSAQAWRNCAPSSLRASSLRARDAPCSFACRATGARAAGIKRTVVLGLAFFLLCALFLRSTRVLLMAAVLILPCYVPGCRVAKQRNELLDQRHCASAVQPEDLHNIIILKPSVVSKRRHLRDFRRNRLYLCRLAGGVRPCRPLSTCVVHLGRHCSPLQTSLVHPKGRTALEHPAERAAASMA
jgi:hypothetical protein